MTNTKMNDSKWYVLAVLNQGATLTRKFGQKNYSLSLKKGSNQLERVAESTVNSLLAFGFLKSRIGTSVSDLVLADAGCAAITAEQAKLKA